MGNTLLKWKEPLESRRSKPKSDRQFSVLQSAARAVGVWLWIQGTSRHKYEVAVVIAIASCLIWILSRRVPQYEIDETGIRYRDAYRRLHLKWSDIEWYLVSPVKTVPSLMQVRFYIKNVKLFKIPPAFVFDPQKVDAQELQRVLETRLPQKELRGWAQQKGSPSSPWA